MRPDSVRLLSVHHFSARLPREQAACRRCETVDELIVMLGGVYQAWPEGGRERVRFKARGGDVVYWPAGSTRVEESDPGDPMRCIAVYFHWSRAPLRMPVQVCDRAGVVRLLANRLLALRALPAPVLASVPNHYVAAMTAEILHLLSMQVDSLVGRVAHYVETHMSRAFTLVELSREMGLQRHHFGRRFKALTGLTPMDYVRRRKADYALNSLLVSPDEGAAEIAAAIGVADRCQLSRLLKACYGVTVRDIRRGALARARPRGAGASKGARSGGGWLSSITASLLASSAEPA